MNDLKPILEKLYPENSHGGQCVTFAHKLVDFPPIGNYLKDKINAVNKFGIPVSKLNNDFRLGDVVITRESPTNGHGFIINAFVGNKLRATESNYRLDEKVHHTRLLDRNSKQIIGIIRGSFKFQIIEFPMNIKTQTFFNNQHWSNEQAMFIEAGNDIFSASGGRINLNWETSKYTDFTNIPFGVYMFPFTNESADAPSAEWYLDTLYPLNEKADILFFVANRQDWNDTNPANGYTYGYCHNQFPPTFPPFISMMVEEGDKAWNHPTLNAFTHYVKHELCHQLYNISGKPDRTHELDNQGRLNEAFNDFDYDKINQSLINKRKLNEPMYVFQKEGDSTLYFAVGKVLVPFANTYDNFLADFKDAIVVKLAPDEFLKFKIANKNVVKAR